MKNCSGIQKSLNWCEGTPEPAGIRRKAFYISAGDVVKPPQIPVDELGRPTSATLTGDWVLDADATFKSIEFLPEKSTFTSEAQGEYPSQTQLDKLTLVHPGVGPEATAACAYINNTHCYFIFQDMKGRWRVCGNKDYPMSNSVAQDLGQGATGTTSTTITANHTNLVAAPFFSGKIITEDGDIMLGAATTAEADPKP